MRLTKLAVLGVLLLGLSAPAFAAIPTAAEAEDAVNHLQQTTDPKVENAQKAFLLAIEALNEPGNPNLAKIQAILEKEDFQSSLEKSVYDADIRMGDPKAEEKLFAAYANNKYIKQLVDLIIASQTEYKETDLNRDVVTALLLQSFALASLMQ